jgi:hypothetical protein
MEGVNIYPKTKANDLPLTFAPTEVLGLRVNVNRLCI